MTREEFENHLDQIIVNVLRIERYKDDKGIVDAHQKDIAYHCEELTKFYDRHDEEEKPETLIYLQNRKDDIEFHLYWRCEAGSFEYQSYEEELQDVQRKIDELTKEKDND